MSNVVIIDLCDSQSSSSTNPLEYSQSEFLLCDSRKRKTKDRNEGSDTNVILLDDSGNEKFDALVPPESQKAFTKSDRSEKQASKKRAKQDEKELAQKEKEEEKLNKKLEKGDRWWAEIACILPGDDSFGPLVQERLNKGWQSATDKECIEKFSYFTDYECKFAGLYRWTWRSTIRGGCCDLLADPSPRILQHACFIFPARNFLDLVIKKDDYKNFGPLSKFMHELQTSMIKDGKCPQGTRLVVLLENVHKHYSKCVAARNSSGHGHKLDSLILAARFDQAVAFLTYDLSIDVVVCEDQESLCSQIAIMHRSLGLMLYKAPATNLDCIQKKIYWGRRRST